MSTEPKADSVEDTAKGLSDAERAAVAEIVSNSINSTVKDTATKTFNELVAKDRIEVGDELNPVWAKHSARFLNAFAKKNDGDVHGSQELMQSYKKDRSGLSESAQKFEQKEAYRIITNSSLSKEQKMRIQSTLTDPAGQFLLPKPFLAEIFVTLEEFGVARRLFRGIPMGSKTLDLKDVASKPAVFWENENAKITETSVAFGEKQLIARKLAALLPWTMELEEDEVFGVVSLASQLFGEQMAKAEDSAGFTGGGSSDTGNGGFTGMLNLENAVVHSLGSAPGSGVTSIEGMDADDLNRAKYKISVAKRRNARWFFHDSAFAVIERLKDNEGQYIYRQPAQPGMPGTIWGDPVEWVEVLPDIDTEDQVGLRFAAYGNPANMLFGTRRGITFDIGREATIIDSSTAENSYSAFQQDGAILRVTQRLGFQTPLDDHFVVLKTAAS